MSSDDLIKEGFKPQECRIGVLYFRDGFFCRFINDCEVLFFSSTDDMEPIGKAKTIQDIMELERKYYSDIVEYYEAKASYLRELYNRKYGNNNI